jgi:hypothetical protein
MKSPCTARVFRLFDLFWVGEYQVRDIDGVWTNWTRFARTLTVSVPDIHEVVEVRSRLYE